MRRHSPVTVHFTATVDRLVEPVAPYRIARWEKALGSGQGLYSVLALPSPQSFPHQTVALGLQLSALQNVNSRQTFSAETVMGWTLAVVALGLVLTALTIAEVSPPVRAMTFGHRVIIVFVLSTCILAIVTGLVLLAAETLP